MPLPLRTERLILRPYRSEDAEASLSVYADADVARYLLDEPWTPQLARTRVAERLERTSLDGPRRSLALVIERDGVLIGDVALWLTDETGRKAEIGWVLGSAHAGQGYASEAVRAVLAAAFEHHGLHRVEAQMDARNEASARLSERLGMTREALLRCNWWSKGEWTSTLIFGLLADDAGRTVGPTP